MQGTLARNHVAHGDSCVAFLLSAQGSGEDGGTTPDGYSEHLIHDPKRAHAYAQRLAAEGRHVFVHRLAGPRIDRTNDGESVVLNEYKPLPVLFPWAV